MLSPSLHVSMRENFPRPKFTSYGEELKITHPMVVESPFVGLEKRREPQKLLKKTR